MARRARTTWFFKSGDPLSVKIESVLTKSQAPIETALRSLLSDVVKEARYNTNPLKQDAMPQEDIDQWRDRQICEAANRAYGEYIANYETDMAAAEQMFTTPVKGLTKKEEEEAIDVMRSPQRTDVEFFTNQCPEIRKRLVNDFNWPPQDAAAVNSGRIGGVTIDPYNQRAQKLATNRHNAYVGEYNKDKNQRDHFGKKGAPYPPRWIVVTWGRPAHRVLYLSIRT